MKFQYILNLLNKASDSKMQSQNGSIAKNKSNEHYAVENKIFYNIVVLKSNLYDSYNPFHLAMGDSTINGCKQVHQVACKN